MRIVASSGGSRVLDLRSYAHALRARWAQILVLMMAGVIGAFAGLHLNGPRFESTVQMYVSSPGTGSLADLAQGNSFSEGRITTYLTVVKSPTVLKPVIDQVGLNDSPDMLASRITVTADRNTVVLSISVRDVVPETAATLATAIARQAKMTIEALETSEAAPGSASPVRLTVLTPQGTKLSASSEGMLLHLMVGAVFGLAAGIATALVKFATTQRLTGEDSIRKLTSLEIVGRIPLYRRLRRHPEESFSFEPFQQLRTNVAFSMALRNKRSVLFSSPVRGEGKTVIAVNLAKAFARAGSKVLLVDANFRHPFIADSLSIDDRVGLSSVLAGTARLEDSVQLLNESNIHILTTGPLPPNPAELLASPLMAQVLAQLESTFDVVILDGPGILHAAEVRVLAGVVDGLFLVVAQDTTTEADLLSTLGLLEVSSTKSVNLILNGVSDVHLRPLQEEAVPAVRAAPELGTKDAL